MFLGRSFGKHAPPWEVSPGEASDNAGDLFDMALKIGKEKLQSPYCLEPDILLTMSESIGRVP